MAVDLQTIFDQKVREFKQGNAPERFNKDFTDAANKVVKELSLNAHDQATIAPIGGTADSISIDDIYHYVVSDGISYFLSLRGQKPIDGTKLDQLKAMWDDAIGSYIMDILNTKQEDVTTGVIGLGAVGTNAS